MSVSDLVKKISKYEILYVEDEEQLLETGSSLFNMIFKRVDKAKDGLDALEQYNKYYEDNGKYHDIIISDINMPRMNGMDLIKEIKKINIDQQIIVVSAYNETKIIQNLINIGARGFVFKPLTFESLLKSLDRISKTLD